MLKGLSSPELIALEEEFVNAPVTVNEARGSEEIQMAIEGIEKERNETI